MLSFSRPSTGAARSCEQGLRQVLAAQNLLASKINGFSTNFLKGLFNAACRKCFVCAGSAKDPEVLKTVICEASADGCVGIEGSLSACEV
jgi:hypothetical protein